MAMSARMGCCCSVGSGGESVNFLLSLRVWYRDSSSADDETCCSRVAWSVLARCWMRAFCLTDRQTPENICASGCQLRGLNFDCPPLKCTGRPRSLLEKAYCCRLRCLYVSSNLDPASLSTSRNLLEPEMGLLTMLETLLGSMGHLFAATPDISSMS